MRSVRVRHGPRFKSEAQFTNLKKKRKRKRVNNSATKKHLHKPGKLRQAPHNVFRIPEIAINSTVVEGENFFPQKPKVKIEKHQNK